jgi:hypothetical protein
VAPLIGSLKSCGYCFGLASVPDFRKSFAQVERLQQIKESLRDPGVGLLLLMVVGGIGKGEPLWMIEDAAMPFGFEIPVIPW